MNFGGAIDQLRSGKRVARKTWEAPAKVEGGRVVSHSFQNWLMLVDADGYDILSARVVAETVKTGQGLDRHAWIGFKTVDNALVPWVPQQQDLLSVDWVTIK